MTRVFFFGVHKQPGHYLFGPGWRPARDAECSAYAAHSDDRPHIDSTYAPRTGIRGAVRGRLCWIAEGRTRDERQRIGYDSEERPQGEYLRHVVNGWSLLSWWDRCQGDTRGNCNSTILVEGEHDASALLAALAAHFPNVLDNLRRAGVELRPVPEGTAR